MTDLLTGSPAKKICAFCGPLLIGNLFQQFYSMADSIVVSQVMGTEAFAAVSSTGSINFLVIGFVQGMCSGCAIPIAQDFGAGDMKGVKRALGACVWIGLLMTLVMSVAMHFFTDDLLRLLNTKEELFDYAYSYIYVIFVGMFTTMLYNMLAAILRALGDSRTPLYFLIIACLLNIGLDILFVASFHMGVAGAAYATLLAQLISGVLCFFTMKKRFPNLSLKTADLKYDSAYMNRLFSCGVPMGLQFSITAIGSVAVQSSVNSLDVSAIAAMGAGGKVCNFVTCPLDSLGIAIATFVGQNYGAARLDRIRKGLRQMMAIGLFYCVFAFLMCLLFGKSMTGLIGITDEEVLNLSQHFLSIYSLFYPALLIIYIFRNAVQGLGFSREAMLSGLFELVGRVAVAFGFITRFGFEAACFASPAAWVAADVLLLCLYHRKMGQLWRWQLARERVEKMRAEVDRKAKH